MRFPLRLLRPAVATVLIGIGGSSSFAQTCVCPPPDQGLAAPTPETYGDGRSYTRATPVPLVVAEEPPPPIPDYDQPPPPGPDYAWTPGYWAWNDDDYYWVPGIWAPPPEPGVLWTPSYWAFNNGVYVFRRGYWGPRVGYYGGVNYGYGYFGHGYDGGRWEGDRFRYNSAVNNLGPEPSPYAYHAPITLEGVVINNVAALAALTAMNRTGFVGGPGGLRGAPSAQERAAAAETRLPPTALQRQQVRAAAVNPQQFLGANQGKPPVAATPRPGDFKGPGVMPARAAGGPIPQAAPNGQGAGPNGQPAKLPPGAKPPVAGQAPAGMKPPVAGQPNPVQPQAPGAPPIAPNGQSLKPGPGLKPRSLANPTRSCSRRRPAFSRSRRTASR